MKEPKLGALGLLILAGSILLIVSAFTPCWITSSDYYGYYSCQGTVFWGGTNYWADLASWEIVLCIVLYVIMCFAFYKAVRKIKKNGYSRRFRKWFKIISVLSAVTVFFLVFAVVATLISPGTSYYNSYHSYAMGYSGWIALASAVLTIAVFIVSTHIMMRQQWVATPAFQTVQIVQQQHQQPQTVQMVQLAETTGVAVTGASQGGAQMYQVVQPQAVNPSVPATVIATPRPTSPIYQVVPSQAPTVQPVQVVQPVAETIHVPQIYQVAPSAPPAQQAQPAQPVYVVYPNSS